MTETDHLIINNPYQKPEKHLKYNRETRKFKEVRGRRPAGYVVASENSDSFDDPGNFIELPEVNEIRRRVDAWREAGYPCTTGTTRALLEHWKNPEKNMRLFFCQIEAIETLIWLIEGPDADKQGIKIEGDGGPFERLCSKMAGGIGKTVVMAMLIAWQTINKATYPKDSKFSKNILIVSPSLTVKSRLHVLNPSDKNNYYQLFEIVPHGMFDKLRQGRVKIINCQDLAWESEEQILRKKTVDKRGPKSDEAYIREVLDEMSNAKNIAVINDEAHHAWRKNPEAEGKYVRQRDLKDSAEEATIWIGGLDRIHRTRGIRKCFDFSATPFYPSGKKASEDLLFNWIVSDFSLNDAIESGLVKTPRVVVRDDANLTKDIKSRFYHIYKDPTVEADLSSKAEPNAPLPDLVTSAYYHLGLDWRETLNLWRKSGMSIPPAMITVTQNTSIAARLEHAFMKGKIKVNEFDDPSKILRIDTKKLKEAEARYESSRKDSDEALRQKVDTVGKEGEPGEQIQNVISVGMLSEGWDANTVTHIMGLRAFSSQLLCEQVVGRGLRRSSYEVNSQGLLEPEYVNIFGVPFTFLPHEPSSDTPPPPKPKTRVFADDAKKEYMMKWPNVISVNHDYRPVLSLDMEKVENLELKPENTPLRSELAPFIDSKPDMTKLSDIDLAGGRAEKMLSALRKQRLIFEISGEVHGQMKPAWKGNREYLLIQLVRIVEKFIGSDRIQIKSEAYREDSKKRLLILLNMNRIVQHVINAIKFENAQSLAPIFDKENPIKSTEKMMAWYTSKPCELTLKSHVSHAVFDSTWEASEAFELDRSGEVVSWAKNDHLGFAVNYVHRGAIHRYYPDFLVKLKNGRMLVLEVKGKDDQKNKAKRDALDEWVRAVNGHGGFGEWRWDVSFRPSDVKDKIRKHSG